MKILLLVMVVGILLLPPTLASPPPSSTLPAVPTTGGTIQGTQAVPPGPLNNQTNQSLPQNRTIPVPQQPVQQPQQFQNTPYATTIVQGCSEEQMQEILDRIDQLQGIQFSPQSSSGFALYMALGGLVVLAVVIILLLILLSRKKQDTKGLAQAHAYIRMSLESNKPLPVIKSNLKQAGWPASEVEHAFETFKA